MLTLSLAIAATIFLLTVWRPKLGVGAVILLWPAYLLRTELFSIPTTALELSVYATVAGTVVALLMRRLPWHWVQMTRLTWWLLGLWVLAWITATLMADDRQAALGAFKAWLLDPLAFTAVLAIVVQSTADRRFIISAAILSTFHVAIAGLAQLGWWRETLQEGRLSSYFAPVANYAAMYLGPLVALQLGLLLHRDRTSRWWWLVFAISLVALIATLSFAAYLAFATSTIFLWYLLPVGKIKKHLLVAGLVGGALAAVVIYQTPNFRQHFDFGGRSSGSVRQQIWVTSWALITQDPMFGVGPNNFEQAYRDELPKHYFPPLEWLVAQPHNLALALWLETGLLGLVAFFALLLYHFYLVWRHYVRQPSVRAVAIASLAGLVAIMVHGLFDTPYFKNDLALLFLFIAILPWLGQRQEKQYTENKLTHTKFGRLVLFF